MAIHLLEGQKMNAVLMTIVLAGSTWASATQVTGRELALLRVILRESMSMDRHAACESSDALRKDRVSPLDLVLNDPNVDALHKIMTNEANDSYKRFNAARALAYLADMRCIDILKKALAGEFAVSSSGFEQSQAAACLLYLDYDFPKDFLFTRLPNPLYPELNALLEDPNQPLMPPGRPVPQYSERYVFSPDPNLPYTNEQVEKVATQYLNMSVGVFGPLSTGDVQQVELQFILDLTATHESSDLLRLPFADRYDAWRDFKKQMRSGDLLYFFASDGMSPSSVFLKGYVLIRGGQVAAHLLNFVD